MQLCMIACSLVHIACARSTNIDPSAAGALRGNFSQPTQECCLGAPEAAHPLLAGSRLNSACEPNGWATFSLLVLAPAHINRDGGGNKEVIRPPNCQAVAQRGRNSAPLALPELGPCICRAHPSAPGGRRPSPRLGALLLPREAPQESPIQLPSTRWDQGLVRAGYRSGSRRACSVSTHTYTLYHAHAVVFPLQLTAGGWGAHLRRG